MLVVPPSTLETEFGRLASAGAELPLLGMAYIASAIRKIGHPIFLKDYYAEAQSWDSVERDIVIFQPDVIATAGFINNMDRCLKLFEIAKRVNPKIVTVLGGPQASIFPDDAMQSPHLDCLTTSESEISFSRLVSYVEDIEAWSTFKGVVYRHPKTGEIIKNEHQPLMKDLDSVPFPALDLYPMRKYYPAVYIRGKKVATLVTSRGCPYNCTFCNAKMTYGRTLRYHSEKRVINELDYLMDRYGFDSFQFYDDMFTAVRSRVIKLCEVMLKTNRKYQWMCYTRTDRVDLELLKLMKRAGCYMISYGIEAGDQVLLDKIRKNLTVEDNQKAVEWTSKAGILNIGTFMLGLPSETPEQTKNTIDFACKNKFDYAIFGITEPYPGTDLWNDALQEGYFIEADDQHTNVLLPNFSKIWVPNGRKRSELEAMNRRAYKSFYFRPRAFLRWLINFAHIPLGRSFRYIKAGVEYIILFPAKDLLDRLITRFFSALPFSKNKKDKPKSHFGVKYG
ncbi:MAG: radical SAM protein [Candidatus Omnitrophica bacterium]|nr:radical SAM protein [Candidatus Omnitrophota bacterium]